MTITVLVPDDHGVAALGVVPGVRAVRYDSERELPDDAEVLVPPFLGYPDALLDRAAALPKLRLVHTLTAGAERWIGRVSDGVDLAVSRGAHGGSTSEWAMAVLLSIYRELREFDHDHRAGVWRHHQTDTLQGKRILVIGAGDLGRRMRRKLEAFDAEATLVGSTARDGVHGVDELPALLGEHDAVVLMVPLTDGTRGMVDAAFLSSMRDGAVLVNAARGPVVHTDALLAELEAGRLRAALDVTDPEPLPDGHPLWTAPGLLLTPHVAGSVRGQRDRAYGIVAANLRRLVAGEILRNLVTGDY
ncbi:2-hydroxyacid dehydrogenase [Herbihabitans rhizosphaerae]|uniref:2-hydroxyacid dehydrogenase n=1 Tax=Herbihabitans rhizosphaerae TaxID=1872711 RepID=UPI00102CB1E0|nr:2-hydroxyacid dehydrogenase [Herbihabitans rhizosphaerae]